MQPLRSIERFGSARRRTATLIGVVLAVGITGFTAPTASAAGDSELPSSQVTSTADWRQTAPNAAPTPISLADAALAIAKTQIQKNHPQRAIDALQRVQINVRRANVAAKNQIGKPPTDPESDDPPGPPAVFGALGLDHRVASGLVPLYDGATRAGLVDALGQALYATQRQRNLMLDKVIALPPEGAGADYSDGMADRLGAFTKEVNQLSAALSSYQLTTAGQQALDNAHTRAVRTKAKVDKAFGGGE